MKSITLGEYTAEGPHEATNLPKYPAPYEPQPLPEGHRKGDCATVGDLMRVLAALPPDTGIDMEGCDCVGGLRGWYYDGDSLSLLR